MTQQETPAGFDADIVIVGSGVGAGAIAHQLAGSGARILMLERGPVLPQEPQRSDAEAVFVQNRYRTSDTWQDESGRRYRPGQYYYLGGHTKFYGTAMFRLRQSDFDETAHEEGVSPAWPISYDDLEPYYADAERLFGVRGAMGEDVSEAPRSAPYDHLPVPHEPLIARMAERMQALGHQPFHMPSAIDLGEGGACRRCGTCDAFACRFDAKGDAQTRLINGLRSDPRIRIWTDAQVTRLMTEAGGQRIVAAEVLRNGSVMTVRAPMFVLSAGAINSALILLRSANEYCPDGVANRSGVVGRYLMNHHLTGLMGILPFEKNLTNFPKTLSINDFYHGLPNDPTARGNIQMLGNIQGPMIRATYPWVPRHAANWLAQHSVDWLFMSEDPPVAQNRVQLLDNDQVQVRWKPADFPAHDRFVRHGRRLLRKAGFPVVLRHGFGIESPSHQCGTVRMGTDPKTSAIDPLCRAHDHENLHVVDGRILSILSGGESCADRGGSGLEGGGAFASQLGEIRILTHIRDQSPIALSTSR